MIITGTYNLKADLSWSLQQLEALYLECDTTLLPVTINLFEIVELNGYKNLKIYISDIGNNAGTNNIAINTSGLDTINIQGQTAFTITQNGACCTLNIMTETKWAAFTQTVITQSGLTYKGTWDAATNTPVLTSGVGTNGYYYIVSNAGNTNLDGITDWQVGDWAIFETFWQKIDNHDIQAYNTVQYQGIAFPQRSVIDFQGLGVLVSDNGAKTIVTIPQTLPSSNYGLYTQTVQGPQITNTIVESSLIGAGLGTLSVPPNGFVAGDSFHAIITGHINCGNNQGFHIRIKTNSVLLADTGVITLNTATNQHFKLEVFFTVRKLGISGVAAIVSGGTFMYTKNASTTFEGTNFSTELTTGFDTTILNTLTITAQWSQANPNNNIYSELFTLSKTY